jgi:hypothetical protein
MNTRFVYLKASLMTAACLVGLVVALRDLIRVPAEIVARDVVLYMIVYWVIGLYPLPPAAAGRAGLSPLLGRGLLLVLVTLAILAAYALRSN